MVRWRCSSPSPKKPSTVERLCVPFCHSQVARHWKAAAAGASANAVRAPRRASTLTPLLTGVSVAVIAHSLALDPQPSDHDVALLQTRRYSSGSAPKSAALL